MLGEDVHHAGRDAAVRDHGDALRARAVGQRLLLEHDLGVAAEVAVVHAGLDGTLGERQVEVVRDRAHHGVGLAHHRQHRLAVADVERGREEPWTGEWLEELGQMVEAKVGEPDLGHLGVLQQVVGARRALQASSENEHPHRTIISVSAGREREM